MAVKMKGLEKQAYVKGHPGNEKDFISRGIRDEKRRAAVTVDFALRPGDGFHARGLADTEAPSVRGGPQA